MPDLIRPSVIAAWVPFNAPLEGEAIPYLYLDVKGLVTTGMGNLVDPLPAAARLPWRLPSGELASQADIAADWRALKGQPSLAQRHHKFAAAVTRIRLRPEAIDALISARLQANAADLAKRFPAFATWPADAQLTVLSMAWAMGSGFPRKWPLFSAACDDQNWVLAALRCKINTVGNPGVVPRNGLNAAHLLCAVKGGDPALLHGPCTLAELRRLTGKTSPSDSDAINVYAPPPAELPEWAR